MPWSPHNHGLFPTAVRARAVELLLVGRALAREPRFGPAFETVMIELWEAFIMPAALGRGWSGAGSSGAGSSGPAPPASTRKVYIVDFDTKHCNPGNQMAAQGTIKEVDNTESNAKKWENKSNSLSNACDETQVKIGDADKNVMFEKLPSYFRRQVWYPAGDYAKGSELVKMNHNQFKKK